MTYNRPLRLFISYSHRDERYRDQFISHLSSLRRSGVIEGWHDRMIRAGDEWGNEIDRHLEAAHIIVLLISADFMNSDYCYSIELQRALAKRIAGTAQVIPVIVRDVVWKNSPIGQLQAVPKDGRPVTLWSNRDAAWKDVVTRIEEKVQEFAGSGHIANEPVPVQHLDSGQKPTPLRDVDWYAILPADPRVLSDTSLAAKPVAPGIGPHIRLVEGGSEIAGFARLDHVDYVDLDGDGREEAVIRLESDGTMGGSGFLVYREGVPRPTMVAARRGDKLSTTIRDGKLVVTEYWFDGVDSWPVPTALIITEYAVVSGQLVRAAEQIVPGPVQEYTVRAFYDVLTNRIAADPRAFLTPRATTAVPVDQWRQAFLIANRLQIQTRTMATSDAVKVVVIIDGKSFGTTTDDMSGTWHVVWSEPARRWLLDQFEPAAATGVIPALPAGRP